MKTIDRLIYRTSSIECSYTSNYTLDSYAEMDVSDIVFEVPEFSKVERLDMAYRSLERQ
jgi:hypothetical protein